MDLSFIILSSAFLFMYSLKVVINGVDVLYNIYCDSKDRAKEEEDKNNNNNMPESVKHMYS